MNKQIKGRVIVSWNGSIEGKIMKLSKKLSFLGDIDPESSRVIEELDEQQRQIRNRILFFPSAKGSTVGSAVLYGLARQRKAPKLLASSSTDLVTMGGAIFGEIPAIKISKDAFNQVKDGDYAKAYTNDENAVIEVEEGSLCT